MKRLRRRALLSAAIVFLLLLTASVCARIRRDAPRAMSAESTALSATQADPMTRFRTEREALRSRRTGELNDIIHSPSADTETVNLAQRQLMELMETQETETRLEGILRLRGFEDALVTVAPSSVNVILEKRAPSRRENAVILDLILRETGVTAGNVKILSLNQ